MASVTAPEQFLKEPLRSGEDNDMSGFKQPSKVIETEKEMEQETALMDVQGQTLEKVTNSKDTEPLSKALVLTEKSSLSDEESIPIDDLFAMIFADMVLPSVTAEEPTIKFGLGIEFKDQLAVIRNYLLEFRAETQEHYTTLRDNLVELIAFFNRGRDDKKGEVGSSQGQGPQPPPDNRNRPGGGGGSRSEPTRKRGGGGSGGSHRREGSRRYWRYWLNL
ncbi:splicing factor 3B subunit 1-like [Dorcoceras hygrometricum]|uniref:Splicing factor 3B subunit 1-like n=2 Tax=Dorcoceras hygrometricum TaxID=472368 RepID=A0A2Z7CHU8_9LAMI|nr:splicing factor 3B subunit 1-like [Dorcoceras hygrometricum]